MSNIRPDPNVPPAIAVSGSGVYSFGNRTALGGSFTDYIAAEAPKRDSIVIVLNTTTVQDAKILEFLKSKNDDLPPWIFGKIPDPTDTCATRTNDALESGGMKNPYTIGFSFPTDILGQAEFWRQAIGGQSYSVPRGATSIPAPLSEFNSN